MSQPSKKCPVVNAEYKSRILEEADACTEPGEIGALLRREGIYSAYLSRWRCEQDQCQSAALSPKKRGLKALAHRLLYEEQPSSGRLMFLRVFFTEACYIEEVRRNLVSLGN
jgi:hypothetical protein